MEPPCSSLNHQKQTMPAAAGVLLGAASAAAAQWRQSSNARSLVLQLSHLSAAATTGTTTTTTTTTTSTLWPAQQAHHLHRHWQHHQQRNSLATQASPQQGSSSAASLTLKVALRQLYKRVHPDLFTDYPAEQAENERSFKLLQDYLHLARTPSTGPAARTAFHFRFFLIPQQQPEEELGMCEDNGSDADGAGSNSDGAAAAAQFELVQVVLVPPPPPPPQQPGPPSGACMSPGAKAGLRKLLTMCGFGQVVMEGEDEAAAADTSLKLTTFLPEAAEVVRQHESGPAKHETRVATLRAAFRLAHRVVAGFQPGAFSGEQQVQLLQRLAAALELLTDDPPDLFGLTILICHKTGLDAQGKLCLDAAAAEGDEWAAFLGGVDPDYARDKQASAAALRGLEGSVAAAVGVRMLFTAAPYLMTHEYRSFLERLAAHAAEHGPVQVGGSSPDSSSSSRAGAASIPVFVAPSYQLPGQQQQAVVHEAVGYIQVPMVASAQQAYTILQSNAPAALSILSRKAQQQEELQDLTSSVRSRLGLRRLIKDELLSLEEFRSACKRLLYHRDLLLRCNIEGLSVRISDGNRVAPDGSLVDIVWNFDM